MCGNQMATVMPLNANLPWKNVAQRIAYWNGESVNGHRALKIVERVDRPGLCSALSQTDQGAIVTHKHDR